MLNNILTFQTRGNTDIVDITDQIIKTVEKNKIKNGIVSLFVKGSTASLTTIEADKNLYEDLRVALEEIIPMKRDWRHHRTWGDDNGGSHLRASLIGPSLTIPIVDGKLTLGTWQKIVLIDFDTSPRQREVYINCLSG